MKPSRQIESCSSNMKILLSKWRNDIGKLVDDKPNNVLSDDAVVKLGNLNTPDQESIKNIIGHHAGLIKGNILGLYRLLKEKTDFWSNTECNKCGVIGHCAVQCNQPTDRSVEKKRYKSDPELKRRQNQRRRRNKARNLVMRGNIN